MSASVVPEMTLEALRSVPLFASLDDDATRELRSLLMVSDFKPGSPLFRSGDKGDAMYLIETGRVLISVKDTDGNEVTLAELAGGDFFGEMAILDGQARSADATVLEDARLAVLSRQNFNSFVRSNPDVALEMLSAITHRLRRTDELLRQRVSRNANDEERARLTLSDRMADLIAEFGGSWKFIGAAIGFLILWVVVNSLLLRGRAFDAFPYVLLNLVLGMITGLQAPIIMMSQNRQGEKDRLRADLDYRVNLKNELSLSEVLRRLDVLESERLPKLFEEQNMKLKKKDEE
ncbi:MAG: family transcriptional regulator, cyclic receptor protein [Blastocatellia bacterium]|nr:family transcriptional regulator, cyclic receptor protein [Blastocatellia bacterium]